MAGRGDNNKAGSAGRGSNNQSNQGFIADGEDQKKSDHRKKPTGGERSQPSPKTADPDSHRNTPLSDDKRGDRES